MRKVVLGLGISLDGYIARPDGAVDFLFMPQDYSMGPFFATIDTAVMGRKTYDAARKMSGGGFGDSKMKSYVFSHSQPPGERGGLPLPTNRRRVSSRNFASSAEKTFG
jgi:dihydrofolate reductase